jgi:hypothetical protein
LLSLWSWMRFLFMRILSLLSLLPGIQEMFEERKKQHTPPPWRPCTEFGSMLETFALHFWSHQSLVWNLQGGTGSATYTLRLVWNVDPYDTELEMCIYIHKGKITLWSVVCHRSFWYELSL